VTVEAPDPIPRRKLFHEVADRLMARILSGELGPGDQLPSERQLMQVYRVGRPAVREAMQTLERMGLIAISHGERARVLAPSPHSVIDQIAHSARHLITTSPEHLEHLKEARSFFEEGMVRQAAMRAGAADIETLRALVRDQDEARDRQAAFLACDMRFHRRIAAIGGNPIYPAVSQAIFEWLAEFHIDLVSVPGAEDLTVREHARIVEEIERGDADRAAAAMRDHLRRANALYRQYEKARA
jgi:GntR family transcriptional regulator, sialic acid-inducible nan operon repressor